jgi:hypothetical protein
MKKKPDAITAPSLFDGDPQISEHEIRRAAIYWKTRYTEHGDLPARFRRVSGKTSRAAKKSQVEKRFQEGVESWISAINLMIGRLGPELAWRIVSLRPSLERGDTTLSRHCDFLDLIAFIARRRDVENCGPEELGCLSGFSCGLQLHIEEQMPQ